MAEETLRITITAENKQALAALSQTVTSLEGVAIAGKKGGDAMKKVGTDFTGVSRVIQDLPYGFNAISNNLTNILPAAGALGLGISALVAGLNFAQNGTGAWTRGLEGLFGTMSLGDKVNKEYVKSLAEEKVQLDNLFKVAEDNNQSLKVRQQAISKLRETTGPYLQDLTDDQIMTGLAKDAHNQLTEALKKQSIAQAALALGAPIQQKILEYDIELINQKKKAVLDYITASKGGVESISTGPGGPSVRITAEQRQLGVRNQFERDRAALLKKQAEEQAKLNQLQDIAAKNAGIDLKKPPPGGKTETEESKEKKALAEMLKAREAYFAEIDRMAADAELKKDQRRLRAMKGEFDPIGQEKRKQKDLTNLKLTMDGNAALNEVLMKQNELKDADAERLKIANALTDYAVQGITNLVSAMINGQDVGAALGDMFKKIAMDIAMAAAKAAIFSAILSALPGGQGVAAATGGGGGGFLKVFKSLLGFSQGGTVSGPTTGYPVMLHGTEHIVRPDQMKSIIASAAQMGGSAGGRVEVYGRIQGQDIWLSQQRTNTFRNLSA